MRGGQEATDLVKDVLADVGDYDTQDEAVEQFVEALPCVCQLCVVVGSLA